MTRQEKYPDTPYFTYYNANPKNRITGDCVTRALCAVTGKSYQEVCMALCRVQIETRYDSHSVQAIDAYLKELGYTKQKQPRHSDNTKLTGKEFCKLFPHANCLATIGSHHVVGIVDGKILDTWDSSDGRIGNFWWKEYMI